MYDTDEKQIYYSHVPSCFSVPLFCADRINLLKWQTLLKRIMDASGTRGKEKEWDIWETLLQIPTVMVTR